MTIKIIILLFIAGLNTFAWFNDTFDFGNTYIEWLPFISIFLSIIFVFPNFKSRSIEVKLLYLFLAGALYFNSSWYFVSLFDKNELLNFLLRFGISSSSFIKSNILMGISLPLIVMGYKLFELNYAKRWIQNRKSITNKPLRTTPCILISIILLVLSLNVTGLKIGATYIGTSSYYYVLLYRMVLISCVAFSTSSFIVRDNSGIGIKMISNNRLLFLLIICFWGYVAIGGDRGPILATLIILFFGYLVINRMKVTYSQFILFVLVIIGVYSLFNYISLFRIDASGSALSVETFTRIYSTVIDYEQFSNSTQRCTTLAIDGIEKGLYSHSNGLFFIQSLIKGIPYLGNIITDSILPDMPNGTADLLTIQYSGIGYTSGIGTSYIADLYIEFGLIGIIIVSILYGMMVSYFDYISINQSFTSISQYLLIAIFAGFTIYTGRGTLGGFFVYFIHTWIVYISIKFLLRFLGISILKRK
ncbi:MAG: O-antigen polymerase [Bacteroidales bacterium]